MRVDITLSFILSHQGRGELRGGQVVCRGAQPLCVNNRSPFAKGGSRGIGPGDDGGGHGPGSRLRGMAENGGGFGICLNPPYSGARVMKEVQEKTPAEGLSGMGLIHQAPLHY